MWTHEYFKIHETTDIAIYPITSTMMHTSASEPSNKDDRISSNHLKQRKRFDHDQTTSSNPSKDQILKDSIPIHKEPKTPDFEQPDSIFNRLQIQI